MNISGNTILITGGGTGIGEGLAAALHAAGNHVIITGRNRAALERTAAAHPGMAHAVLDVGSAAEIAGVTAKIVAAFPALNILINNAGIMRPEDLLAMPGTTADAEEMVTTNLLGPIRLTAALLPQLRRQEAAAIINVSSGLAFVPLAMTPTYSATKAALHSYSESLRFQLRETPVQVIELAPPAVATRLMPGHDENPNSMPLADFIAESMELLRTQPDAKEICVKRVRMLRDAEADGRYAAVFAALNQAPPH